MEWMEMFPTPVRIYIKQEWGGRFAAGLVPFEMEKRPLENVRFTDTMSDMCDTKEACKAEMVRLQTLCIERLGLMDIHYNFYVCGDGTVYEGRGWNVWSFKPKEYEHLQDCCLDIAFMTDLKENKITPLMKETAYKLVEYGKSQKYLHEECMLIDEPE